MVPKDGFNLFLNLPPHPSFAKRVSGLGGVDSAKSHSNPCVFVDFTFYHYLQKKYHSRSGLFRHENL